VVLLSQTAQGLRVTLHSTIELSMYLLEKCDLDYVLTGMICQDDLEVNIYKFMLNIKVK